MEEIAAADKRVHYHYQSNAGVSAARQLGLNSATGEWVTYVDSDDQLYPQYCSVAKEFFDTHPQCWYATALNDRTLELHNPNHQVLATLEQPSTDLEADSVTLQSYAHWKIKPCGTGLFHRRDIITDELGWDTTGQPLEDLDFLLQLGLQYPKNFELIPKRLYHQRQAFGAEGICSNTSYAQWADAFERLYLKYKDTWLMEGQDWYPQKVEEYRQRQRLFEQGKAPSRAQQYFPEYFK